MIPKDLQERFNEVVERMDSEYVALEKEMGRRKARRIIFAQAYWIGRLDGAREFVRQMYFVKKPVTHNSGGIQ